MKVRLARLGIVHFDHCHKLWSLKNRNSPKNSIFSLQFTYLYLQNSDIVSILRYQR